MSRYEQKVRKLRTVQVGPSCIGCKGLVGLMKYTFLLGVFVACLYVFPPWRMKQAADAIWSAGETAAGVASALVKSEQHAHQLVVEIQKSGRDLWSKVESVGAKPASELVPNPVISIG